MVLVNQVTEVLLDQLDPQETEGLQGPLVMLVSLDLLALQDYKEIQDPKEQLDHLEHQVFRVHLVLRDPKGIAAFQVMLVTLDLQVTRALLVQLGLLEHLELLASLVHLEHKDQRVPLERLGPKVRRDFLALRVMMDLPAVWDLLGHQEIKEMQELLVLSALRVIRDSLEHLEIQVSKVP